MPAMSQVDNEIKSLCEKSLPFSLAGLLFSDIRKHIEKERESVQSEAIRENATQLAKKIVRVVEEPEPIYSEVLSDEKMVELEQRIYRLLREGEKSKAVEKILDLSDRDAARVLQYIETLEGSDIFLLSPLIEERRELEIQLKQLRCAFRSDTICLCKKS